jgi:hypothetical protein
MERPLQLVTWYPAVFGLSGPSKPVTACYQCVTPLRSGSFPHSLSTSLHQPTTMGVNVKRHTTVLISLAHFALALFAKKNLIIDTDLFSDVE